MRQSLQHPGALGGVAGLRLPVEHARRHVLHAHRERRHLPLPDALHPHGGIGHGFRMGAAEDAGQPVGLFRPRKGRALRSPARQGRGHPGVLRIVQSAEKPRPFGARLLQADVPHADLQRPLLHRHGQRLPQARICRTVQRRAEIRARFRTIALHADARRFGRCLLQQNHGQDHRLPQGAAVPLDDAQSGRSGDQRRGRRAERPVHARQTGGDDQVPVHLSGGHRHHRPGRHLLPRPDSLHPLAQRLGHPRAVLQGVGAQLQLHLHGPALQPAGEHPAQPHPAVVHERPLAAKDLPNPHPDTQGHGRDQQPLRTGLRRGAQLPDAEDQLPVRRQRRSLNPREP